MDKIYAEIENYTQQVQEHIYALEREIKDLQLDLTRFRSECTGKDKTPLYVLKNRKIVHYVNFLISNGNSKEDSLLITSKRLCETFERCQSVYGAHERDNKTKKNYSLLFMIDKLEKTGYPKKEIARICGFSEKYLFEFIKKNKINHQK